MRFDGKSALITGGGSGIGQAAASRMADEGATIVIVDRDEAALAETAERFRERGRNMISLSADVSHEEEWKRIVAEVRNRFGRLNVLINNAGFNILKPIADYPLEDWSRLVNTNLLGTFLGMKHSLPLMIESGGGVIVNTASTFGLIAYSSTPAYAAAKGGVIALTRQVALDYATHGIRVNCVCPGPTLTKRLQGLLDQGIVNEFETLQMVLLKRWATPDEIAAVIAFLASDDASYVTGAAYVVDGGQTCH
jgi:NAD(P)-dependent dehydrogenase (short-subunit alcohol dehydrogenase family)